MARCMHKGVTNRKYLLGDFDKDGVPNVDDKRPFDSKNKKRVNKEVSLAKTIRYVQVERGKARKVAHRFAKKNNIKPTKKNVRIKDTYSTIQKAVRRNPMVTNDFIGVRVEGNKRTAVRRKWQRFNKKNNVKKKVVFKETSGADNKYKSNRGTSNHYRAYHSNLTAGGYGVEAQFRTKKYGKLNDKMHEAFKKKKKLKSFAKKGKALRKKGY